MSDAEHAGFLKSASRDLQTNGKTVRSKPARDRDRRQPGQVEGVREVRPAIGFVGIQRRKSFGRARHRRSDKEVYSVEVCADRLVQSHSRPLGLDIIRGRKKSALKNAPPN